MRMSYVVLFLHGNRCCAALRLWHFEKSWRMQHVASRDVPISKGVNNEIYNSRGSARRSTHAERMRKNNRSTGGCAFGNTGTAGCAWRARTERRLGRVFTVHFVEQHHDDHDHA